MIHGRTYHDSTLQGAQRINSPGIDPGDLRQNGDSPAGNQKMIEPFLNSFTGFQILTGNGSFPEIDSRYPMADPGINILLLPENLRGTDDQRF